MKLVIDIEANGLHNPTKIWVIVCKDVDSGKYYVFRNISDDKTVEDEFINLICNGSLLIGHNLLGYDLPVIQRLIPNFSSSIELSYFGEDTGTSIPSGGEVKKIVLLDTFILSKLIDYPRDTGHSVESYGDEFNLPKGKHMDFSSYSKDMEDYCIRDVDITEKIYLKYHRYIYKKDHMYSIGLEHRFYDVVNSIHINGFCYNIDKGIEYCNIVTDSKLHLDAEIATAFPDRVNLVREVTPSLTKFGTLNKKDFRGEDDLTQYNGGSFCRISYAPFNPSSHKQIVDVLHQAGWKPEDKTDTHKDCIRNKTIDKRPDLVKYGWKINEQNLGTLPKTAPAPARLLAKRILVESRRRTLTEWNSLVQEDERIHGTYQSIGAWTHRMSHQNPNTANIANEFRTDGTKQYLGKELRSLWKAPKGRLLVGVDAEGIQLRIFAHYINDKEFTNALVQGDKSAKTDPHSLNQRILGPVCKTRQAAKRFIYALLLGAGNGKLAEVLAASPDETQAALSRLMDRYQGFAYLKEHIIPADARRGWFLGLDGRRVRIPGQTPSERRHLCMSGYLQNGEAVIMKMACLKWIDKLKDYDAMLVNFVHDEWQVEVPNDMKIALQVATMLADSLKSVGQEIGLHCPLAGSFWNDEKKDYTIGTNWSVTH